LKEWDQILSLFRENFKRLFEFLPSPSYIWKKSDNDLVLVDFNAAAKKILSKKMDMKIGIKASQLYNDHKEIFDDLKCCINGEIVQPRKVLNKGRNFNKEKNLKLFYFNLHSNYVLVYIEILTKENLLEISPKETGVIYDSLIEGLNFVGIGIDIIGTDYKILYQNEVLKERFGNVTGEICYEKYLSLNCPCDFCPMIKSIKSNQINRVELIGGDGRNYELISAPYPNPDGTVNKAIEVIIDITDRKQIESVLKQEKRFTETALNTLRDTFFIFNPSTGKAVRWNNAFKNITGYSDEEISSMKAPDSYYSKRDLKQAEITKEKIKRKGNALIEMNLITKDGRFIPFEYIGSGINDEKGNLKYILAIGRNITKRKKAIEKMRYLSSAVEQSSEGIAITDLNGNLLFINKSFAEIHGYDPEELIGKHLSIFHTEDQMDAVRAANKEIRQTGSFIGEIWHVKKNGSIFPTLMHNSILKDEDKKPIGMIGTVRDITEWKTAEQALYDSEKKFREAYNRAEFYKDIFAHDVNNIFQSIQSAGELISLSLNNSEKDKGIEKLIKIINEQVKRGSNLVSIIRNLSELERSELILRKIEIIGILKEAIQIVINSNQDRKINVKTNFSDNKFYVWGNELLLNVFENILNNAIKHNDNQIIDITIRISEVEKSSIPYIKFEFIDNARGIPDKRKERIFQRAFKKEVTCSGSGLGLSLVKKVVDKYKGKIWVKDKVKGDFKKGSIFVMLIPKDK
jgi:PAS domain S-box-containing protein